MDLVSESSNSILLSIFEKNHCTNPSHNDLPIAPRRRVRTTSSSTIVFLTGFDKARKESMIKSVQTIFGRKSITTARNVENNGTIFFYRLFGIKFYFVFQLLMS